MSQPRPLVGGDMHEDDKDADETRDEPNETRLRDLTQPAGQRRTGQTRNVGRETR